MIIICTKTGQLGNRLLLLAHFMANAIEGGYSIADPAFDEYAALFETTRRDGFCRYPVKASAFSRSAFLRHAFFEITRVAAKTIKILPHNRYFGILSLDAHTSEMDISSPEFMNIRKQSRILFVKGWMYRDHWNFWKNRAEIIQYFNPVEKHRRAVETLLTPLRKGGTTLVAVHIRQGDYSGWLDKRYYFDTEVYIHFMQHMQNLLPKEKVRFLICSNFHQEEGLFREFDHVRGTGHFLEDMYAMAGCDYIMAPPSTFSGWSSYYGNVPLFRIRQNHPNFTLESFGVYGKRE